MSQFTIELQAPQQALFSYLADPRNRPDWQSSIVSLEMDSEGAPRVGMKWREHARGFGRFEMEITECLPASAWAEHGHSERGSIDLRLEFEPTSDPSTTRLTLTLDMRLRGVFSLVGGMAPFVIAPLMKADLRRAAQLAIKPS